MSTPSFRGPAAGRAPRCARRPVPGAWALAIAAAAAVLAASAAQPAVPTNPKRLEALADSLRLGGNADSSVTLARRFQRQAMARGDTAAALRGHLVESRMYSYQGRARDAEYCARLALRLARASHDSAHEREALLEVGTTLDAQGRAAEAMDIYRDVGARALEAGDRATYARARMYLGRMASAEGRFEDARRDLVFARAVFDSLQIARDELNASNLLGIALFSLMDLEGAAECFRHCAQLGRELGNPSIEGRGLNNLARIAYSQGDLATAERLAEQALQIQRAAGNVRSLTIAMLNVGEARARLGRYTEAAAVIEEARALAEQHELFSEVCAAHSNLGYTRWLEGRNAQSAAHYRDAIAQSRGKRLFNEEVNALLGLARALSSQDSVAAAYDLLASRTGTLRGKIEPAWEIQLDDHLASFLTSLGRHAEAVPLHRDVEQRAVAGGLPNFQVMTTANLVDSYAALGQVDSAMAALRRGVRVWESQRVVPIDPRWREERGQAGRQLFENMAALLLEHPASLSQEERIQRAFDALQGYKARTLLERMLGPGVEVSGSGPVAGASAADSTSNTPAPPSVPPPPVTLAELQATVLEEGELLLDLYAGAKQTVVFAVTRSTCRAQRIPEASTQLGEKLDLLRGLMDVDAASAAGRDPAAVARACGAVGQALLGPFSDLLGTTRRILFAADGPANLLALAALVPPGADEAHVLVADHELVRVPSATVLAWLRRPERSSGSPPGTQPDAATAARTPAILALAGDAAGDVRLPAAAAEARGLGRSYRGVEVRIGSAAAAAIRDPQQLGAYDVLHLAAHAEVDDENPWRSGIVLAADTSPSPAPEPPAREDAADPSADPAPTRGTSGRENSPASLRAASIAGLPLKARLAVLSACNSAGGRVVSGEGVLGLTGAFLAAGVPSVVATLWPVDDHTTARLMEHFYRRLAGGASAAEALRGAQLALQSDAATSDPFYWAGFVLVGEGDTRLELRRRTPSRTLVLVGLSMVLVLAVTMRGRRTGR